MRVVSNTSPLFYLHSIRQIELLARLYGQIAWFLPLAARESAAL
jgi:predicted nucleic acid-binding protein